MFEEPDLELRAQHPPHAAVDVPDIDGPALDLRRQHVAVAVRVGHLDVEARLDRQPTRLAGVRGDPLIEQLALCGVSAAQIAKRTALKRATVDAALTVVVSQATKARIDNDGLTLDQAAIFAEFEGDDQATEKLTRALSWNRPLVHVTQQPYQLTPDGQRVAVFYTKVHDRILRPLIAADCLPAPPELRHALRVIDNHVHDYIERARLGKAA
jgi:hypothetical protein